MKIAHQRVLIIFILTAIFLAPGIVAWLYYRHPTWLSSASTNRGRFVSPAYHLKTLDNKHQHWRLIYWNPNSCNTTCMKHADDLARIRLALGRRLYQVDACVLLASEQPDFRPEQTKILQEKDMCMLKLPEKAEADRTALGDKPAFFIASPDNALILTYPITVASDDLFHDIKHLITEPS